ncbi:iron chaperone [Microbacterium tumbae]
MGTIDDYLEGLDAVDSAVIAHVYAVAAEAAGETEQGTSYGMPALLHRGKALLSVMRTRKHIGVYPYSGRVPEAVAHALTGYEHDKGTIRFQPEHPLPDDAIRAIVLARIAEIEDPSLRRRS